MISCVGPEIDFTIADFSADARAATPSNAAELAVPVYAELVRAVDALGERLASGLKARLALSRARLLALGASAALTMPGKLILEGRKNQLETLWQREQAAMQQRLNAAQRTLALAKRSLDALNPMSVLRRGFAVVEKADGALVTEAKSLREGEGIAVLLHDGRLRAHVDAVEEKPEETQADCAP